MARLIIKKGSQVERAVDVDVARLVIGRSTTCDVVLPVEVVSRQHCEIRHEGGYWLVEDRGSTTGTYLNGKRVGLSVLREGDEIGLGQHTLLFQLEGVVHEAAEQLGQIVTQQDRLQEYWEGSEAETAEEFPAHQPGGAMQIGPQAAPEPAIPMHVSPQSAELGRQLDLGGPDTDRYKQTMMASQTQIHRVREALLTAEKPHLQISGPQGNSKLVLEQPSLRVGFTERCAVRLPGRPWFGKLQCQLDRDEQGFFTVAPLTGWWCRVRVDGKPLKRRRNLRDGQVIEVAGVKMRFNQGTDF